MKIRSILLVEDNHFLQVSISEVLTRHFGRETRVFVAGTEVKAKILVQTHNKYLDLILMDTNLGGGVTTFDLTRQIRIDYKLDCPMVATSLDPGKHSEMFRCGCTHAWLKERIQEGLTKDFPIN